MKSNSYTLKTLSTSVDFTEITLENGAKLQRPEYTATLQFQNLRPRSPKVLEDAVKEYNERIKHGMFGELIVDTERREIFRNSMTRLTSIPMEYAFLEITGCLLIDPENNTLLVRGKQMKDYTASEAYMDLFERQILYLHPRILGTYAMEKGHTVLTQMKIITIDMVLDKSAFDAAHKEKPMFATEAFLNISKSKPNGSIVDDEPDIQS